MDAYPGHILESKKWIEIKLDTYIKTRIIILSYILLELYYFAYLFHKRLFSFSCIGVQVVLGITCPAFYRQQPLGDFLVFTFFFYLFHLFLYFHFSMFWFYLFLVLFISSLFLSSFFIHSIFHYFLYISCLPFFLFVFFLFIVRSILVCCFFLFPSLFLSTTMCIIKNSRACDKMK